MNHIQKKTFRAWWSVVLLATGVLCGCASTTQVIPIPSVEKPTSNKALIVVERYSSTVGGAVGMEVYDNNTFVGKMGPGGKLAWLRDPGLMNIHFGGIGDLGATPGKCFPVKAGKSYHYNLKMGVSFEFEGPGVPTRTIGQASEGALVFFDGAFPTGVKVLWSLSPAQKRALTIANIKTGKTIEYYLLPREEQSHIVLFLPLGEYCILKYAAYKDGGTYTATEEYNINAEFSITKPNVSVYAGSISVSPDKEKPVIRKDSVAAREFLKQKNIDLPYTEAMMELNE
jgi:hypothetical protein